MTTRKSKALKSHLIAACLLPVLTVMAEEPAAPPTNYFAQVPDDSMESRKWQTGPQELPALDRILAMPAEDYPVYGIYAWGNEFQRASTEILKMGFRVARLSGQWRQSEEALKTAAQNQMEILYTVVSAQRHENQRGWKRPDFESDEAFVADYVDAMEEFLKTYGPDGTFFSGTGLKSPVAVVEVLNEPNFHYMIPDREPRAEVLAERIALYGMVLERVAPKIRVLAPTVKIAAFSTGGGGPIVADVPFVQGVTDRHPGIHKLYDILSTHPYMQGAPPEMFKVKSWGPRAMSGNMFSLRDILAKGGAGQTPIWFTELGFPLTQAAGGTLKMPAKFSEFCVTKDMQAAYIVRQYLWAMRLGVSRVHLMSLHDTDSFNSGILERGSLEWRPAAHAIQNLITRMPNPKLLGAISDGEGNTFAYRYIADHTRADGTEVVVAWNSVGPARLEIPWSHSKATLFDMVGNSREVVPVSGKLGLDVGPYPVFVQP
jgi:hypothetical protein